MVIHENLKHDREQQPSPFPSAGAALLALESARRPVLDGRSIPKGGGTRKRTGWFWRLFGGTLLSIAALVILTLTQQFVSILTEVRQDLNRLHESRSALAQREEVVATQKDLQISASNLAGLRERCLLLEQQFKAAEAERGQLARAFCELRERLAEAVGRQSAFSSTDGRGDPRTSR